MSVELERQLAGLTPGEHLCLIYEDAAQQMAAIVPFVKAGLTRGECCLYVADHSTIGDVAAALTGAGVDVQRERERHALVLLTERDTYLRGGRFEPDAMIDLLRRAMARALDVGFTGLRATGEMIWALGPAIGCDRLIEYEAKLNTFFPGTRALAICQYDRRRFAPALIRNVLRTHPMAILGNQVCQNLYYESPDLVLGQISEADRVDWMIANLERMRTTERALRESEDRYRDLVEHSHDLICTHDLEGNILSANQRAGTLLGCDLREVLMKNVRDFLAPEVRDEFDAYLVRIRSDGVASGLMQIQTSAGERRLWEYNNTLRTEGVTAPIVRGVARDVTERKRVEQEIKARARQQAAVAELGQRALAGTDLSTLLSEAVALVARTLEVEFCKVLELLPDGDALLLRAGTGWIQGCVGSARVGAETDSQAGYTLLSGEPVIVEDLRSETRFTGPALLRDHGVVSGMSVIIHGQDSPYGVLGAHTTRRRTFTQDDIHFLQAAANVLAAAITRTRAEEALKISETRFRGLVESSPDGMVLVNSDGGIILANSQTEKLFGYAREELLGATVEMLVPERFRTRHSQQRAGYFASPRARHSVSGLELYGLRKDGSEFPVEINLSYHQTKEALIAVTTIRDITERKRAQETLQALYQASLRIQEPLGLRERLDRLLQTARTVLEVDRVNVLLSDPEGRMLQAIASLGAEEPLEMIRVPIGPEGGGVAQAYLTKEAIVWDGRGPVPETLRLKPPFDQIATLRSRVFANVPLVIEGRAIGVLGVDRKHSRRLFEPAALELLQLFAAQAALAIEHGRLYEAQRTAAIQLEATVEARTRELQVANMQLQEAMRLAEEASRHKSSFLANMSHELRTPLNAILGFSELLAQQTYGPLTQKQARYVDNVHTSGQYLLALINDLLDLSKVEAGKLELRPQPFDLREALEAALHTIRPQAEAKQQALMLQVADDLPVITADPLRVKQILYNLLSNAVKFTPNGGRVTVTARRVRGAESEVRGAPEAASHLAPRTSDATDFVEIAVADTGIGIKPEDLPKLFQPFTQLEQTFTKQAQGTGLGLALTRRLVELHGGTIRAESPGEGRGSTLTIRLPLPSPAP